MISLKSDTKPRELVPAENHIARLYSIVEVGTVPVAYKEEPSRQVRLTWELPEEMREFNGENKPMVIGGKYTASMYKEAKLRKIVEGIVGKMTDEEADEFDLHTILGKACMLNVVHTVGKNGKTYANVASAAPLPKAVKDIPTQFNDSVWFDYSEFDQVVFEKLPEWMRKEMMESEEYKNRGTMAADPFGDDLDVANIPF